MPVHTVGRIPALFSKNTVIPFVLFGAAFLNLSACTQNTRVEVTQEPTITFGRASPIHTPAWAVNTVRGTLCDFLYRQPRANWQATFYPFYLLDHASERGRGSWGVALYLESYIYRWTVHDETSVVVQPEGYAWLCQGVVGDFTDYSDHMDYYDYYGNYGYP